jgi:3-dehydroquinate synthetase
VREHANDAEMPVNLNDLSNETLWGKEALYKRMLHDKKTVNGKINFVLLREIGTPFVCNEVTQQAVYETLMHLGAV